MTLSIAFMESEDDAPVRPDGYAPETLAITFQGVEMKTGQVHVFRLSGKAQDGQDILDFLEIRQARFLDALSILHLELQTFGSFSKVCQEVK